MDRQEAIGRFRDNASDILNNSTKRNRANLIGGLELLERKRFFLSPSPEAKERLERLRQAYAELKSNYPEFFGLTIYGSHTKGYANDTSDIDGHIFLDVDKAFAALDPNNLTEKDFVTRPELEAIYLSQPRAFDDQTKNQYTLSKGLEIKYDRAIAHFLANHGVADIVGPKKLELTFLDQDYVKRCTDSDKKEDYAAEPIITLFNLSLDSEINRYREIVIRELESQGEKGADKWGNLMLELGTIERLEDETHELVGPEGKPWRHAKIYPTLDKARAYFLKTSPKE